MRPTRTPPLFFAQAIGRFVRSRRRGETASVFLPSVAPLLELAAELERNRDHVIKPASDVDPEDLLAEAQRQRDEPGSETGLARETLATTAELDQVIFDGASFGTPIQAGIARRAGVPGASGAVEPRAGVDAVVSPTGRATDEPSCRVDDDHHRARHQSGGSGGSC